MLLYFLSHVLVLLFLIVNVFQCCIYFAVYRAVRIARTHKVILKCWPQGKLPGLKKSQNVSLRENSFV